jgi:hypothetical protein
MSGPHVGTLIDVTNDWVTSGPHVEPMMSEPGELALGPERYESPIPMMRRSPVIFFYESS